MLQAKERGRGSIAPLFMERAGGKKWTNKHGRNGARDGGGHVYTSCLRGARDAAGPWLVRVSNLWLVRVSDLGETDDRHNGPGIKSHKYFVAKYRYLATTK